MHSSMFPSSWKENIYRLSKKSFLVINILLKWIQILALPLQCKDLFTPFSPRVCDRKYPYILHSNEFKGLSTNSRYGISITNFSIFYNLTGIVIWFPFWCSLHIHVFKQKPFPMPSTLFHECFYTQTTWDKVNNENVYI